MIENNVKRQYNDRVSIGDVLLRDSSIIDANFNSETSRIVPKRRGAPQAPFFVLEINVKIW